MYPLYVTAPAGTADLAADELAACGVGELKVERGGVAGMAALEQAYRACLWSRVANRVLLRVAQFPAPTPEALYEGVRTIDWSEHLGVDGTLERFVRIPYALPEEQLTEAIELLARAWQSITGSAAPEPTTVVV